MHIAEFATLLVLGLAAAAVPHPTDDQPAPFTTRTASHSGTILLYGSVEAVFPLFNPVREAEWADGWTIEPVYPQDGSVTEGMVFRTSLPDGRKLTWVMSRLDQERYIVRYTTFLEGDYVGQIEIRCEAEGKQTRARVTYTFTSIGPLGSARVEAHSAVHHEQRLANWQQAINHLLQTGKRLTHHE